MTVIDVSEVVKVLAEHRNVTVDEIDGDGLKDKLRDILSWHKYWTNADSRRFHKEIESAVDKIGSMAEELHQKIEFLKRNSVSFMLSRHFPFYEGAEDEASPSYGAASFLGMQKALAILTEAASTELANLKSYPGGVIFRMEVPPNDLLIRRLAKLYEEEGLRATVSRAHKFNTDSSEGADSKFIRFAETALAALRKADPTIKAYSRDSIASMKAGRTRRGKRAVPKRRKIKAVGT